MISAVDLAHLDEVPHEAKPTALWLWLNLDPLGRGPMDPAWIARETLSTPDDVLEHLVALMDADFLTTYVAGGAEWLLLQPLRVDMRGVRISTPEPPARERPWTSVAVGRGSAGGRERARAQLRAEDAARADTWNAVVQDREEEPVLPERPLILDAPPMFCDDHMPHGAGKTKCGPCRDARLKRDEWLAVRERIVERPRETSPRSEKDTRVRMVEGLILAGCVDVEYIASEMAEEEAERQRRIDSERAAREAAAAESEQGDEVAV